MNRSREVVVYVVGQVFQQAVVFSSSIIVARWLGPGDFGILGLTRSIYYVVLMLAPLGLDISLLRHIAQHEDEPVRINRQITVLRLLVSGATCATVLLTFLLFGPLVERGVYHYPEFALFLTLTVLALPPAADLAVLGAVCRARHHPETQVLASVYLQPAARFVLIVLFLYLGQGLAGVLVAQVIGTVIASVTLGTIILFRNRRTFPGAHRLVQADWSMLRLLIRDSKWLAFSVLIYGMLRFVDVMILGVYRPAAEVGEYAAISAVAQIIQFIPQSLSQTLGADVARLFAAGNFAGLKSTLSNYLRHASLLSAPVFAGVVAFGPWLDLLFGHRFVFRQDMTLSLALGFYIAAVLGPMGFSLSMTGRHRLEFGLLLTGTLLTIAGCVAATQQFGALGTASAVACGYFVINGVRAILVQRIYRFFIGKVADLLPPVIALAIAFLVREGGAVALGRSLPSLIALGFVYLMVCGGAFWVLLLRDDEKSHLAARLPAFLRAR
jgi:O-antigen/teichoic acid export membrane protein